MNMGQLAEQVVIRYGSELNALLALLVVMISSSDLRNKRIFLFVAGGAICLVLTIQVIHCL